ncbi:MAG: GNAT family N-acetyltransferase [Conexivisphaera sp.]
MGQVSVLVRRMSEDDIDGMRDLWLELVSEYGGDELEYDGAAEEMWRRAMRASLSREDLRVLVAESSDDGSIVGYVFYTITKSPLRSRYDDHVYISDMVVRSDARRAGIASALLKGLLEDLGTGRHRVYLRVPAGNVTAVSFYEKNGFRISEYVMELSAGAERSDSGSPRGNSGA